MLAKGILSAPHEVLELIADTLLDPAETPHLLRLNKATKRDACTLRLTCKTLANLKTVGSILFGTINVFMTDRSIECLKNISRSPNTASHVNTLRFWHPLLDNCEWTLSEYRHRIQPNLPYTRSTVARDSHHIPQRGDDDESFMRETAARFILLKALEQEQQAILRELPTTLDGVISSLPSVTKCETQTQTLHSSVLLGIEDCRHDSYLARHYPQLQLETSGTLHPELQLEFTGSTHKEASHFDNHLGAIFELLSKRHKHVTTLHVDGGVSQIFLGQRSWSWNNSSPQVSALRHIQHLRLSLITLDDLNKFIEGDTITAFPPYGYYTEFSTDFSRTLECVFSQAPGLRTIYVGIGDFDPSFRGEFLGWTTRNLEWRSLHWPHLQSFAIEDAAVDVDDLSAFLAAHAASLEHLDLKFIQMESEPRESWRKLLFTINRTLSLKTVKVHSATKSLWESECPRIWCPKLPGDDRSGLVPGMEFPPTLRDFLLGRTPWTAQLEQWLKEDHQNVIWGDYNFYDPDEH